MVGFGKWTKGLVQTLAVSTLVLGMSSSDVQAQQSTALSPVVIGNDRGGRLRDRLRQINEIRRTGQPVQVVGNICYSTCTMFLGLPQTCVSPNTVFGFHGPSSWGRPLEPAVFERASEIISDHYPEPLRVWYMQEARHTIWSLHRVRGSEMIRLGVAAC